MSTTADPRPASLPLVDAARLGMALDNSYANDLTGLHAPWNPSPAPKPGWLALNTELAQLLGLNAEALAGAEGLAVLSGQALPTGAEPIAQAYAGHQFGHFSPQLGDGRALLLGEVIDTQGQRRDIAFKGSGRTPFSRGGDGKAAVGPVLREYLMGEAMQALGIPTTRALAAIATGEQVFRERPLPGALLVRVAASHLRVGTFQFFAARQDLEKLRRLADYTIARHDPDLAGQPNPYLGLLRRVAERQAALIAQWMGVGFIHGVMNTDNMSISGETIDYGPCAFLDTYHPLKKFSSIDQRGRYAFARQGEIGHWNLTRLAETLIPLIDEDQEKAISLAETALESFPDIHHHTLQQTLTAKIGLEGYASHDWPLVTAQLDAMSEGEADFTLVFRHLPNALETGHDGPVVRLFNHPEAITSWLGDWRARLQHLDKDDVLALMRRSNPIFIPRNHRIEEAIQAAYRGDYSPFHRLVDVLKHPFTEQPDFAEYEAAPTPAEVVQATFCGT